MPAALPPTDHSNGMRATSSEKMCPNVAPSPLFDGGGVSLDVAPSPLFEGVEKILTVRFDEGGGPGRRVDDLRTLPRGTWDAVCATARCTILSHLSSHGSDAYVLSESSLFVTPSSILMKTCGTTTLLAALPEIVRYCGVPLEVQYTHHEYMVDPATQEPVYQAFKDEVAHLDALVLSLGISKQHGRAAQVGPYSIYTTNPDPDPDANAAGTQNMGSVTSTSTSTHARPGQHVLEVNMFALAPEKMKQFWRKGKYADAAYTTQATGIAELWPESHIDAYMFEPCGYSMNGLAADGVYWTIHVSPEDDNSYVSFEINCKESDVSGLVARLQAVFRPGRMSVLQRHAQHTHHGFGSLNILGFCTSGSVGPYSAHCTASTSARAAHVDHREWTPTKGKQRAQEWAKERHIRHPVYIITELINHQHAETRDTPRSLTTAAVSVI